MKTFLGYVIVAAFWPFLLLGMIRYLVLIMFTAGYESMKDFDEAG